MYIHIKCFFSATKGQSLHTAGSLGHPKLTNQNTININVLSIVAIGTIKYMLYVHMYVYLRRIFICMYVYLRYFFPIKEPS